MNSKRHRPDPETNYDVVNADPYDPLEAINDVASMTECTGLIPTPPTSESEAESYTDLFKVPKPQKEKTNPTHRGSTK